MDALPIREQTGLPFASAAVLHNDPELGERLLPSLERVAGGPVPEPAPNTASEDFGLFTEGVPGMYFGLGVAPASGAVYPNHSPRFTLDEGALVVGVRGLSHLAVDFLDDFGLAQLQEILVCPSMQGGTSWPAGAFVFYLLCAAYPTAVRRGPGRAVP